MMALGHFRISLMTTQLKYKLKIVVDTIKILCLVIFKWKEIKDMTELELLWYLKTKKII
jgi:hypothetical protein